MFNRKKQPPIKSLVALGCQIDGNFNFADGLRLAGSIHGNILGQSDRPSILVISESAVVLGEIHADHVIINGKVDGPVFARLLLELQPKARITGDVTYKLLEMHQGAIVAGKLCPLVGEVGALAAASVDEKPTLKLAANNP
jgi:cytoskeletal protein CcmA (bactofilin family)